MEPTRAVWAEGTGVSRPHEAGAYSSESECRQKQQRTQGRALGSTRVESCGGEGPSEDTEKEWPAGSGPPGEGSPTNVGGKEEDVVGCVKCYRELSGMRVKNGTFRKPVP